MENVNLYRITQKADELRYTKLKVHKAINHVYEDVVQAYEAWRTSEDGARFICGQLEKLGYVCPVCSEDLTEKSATVDHLMSKRRYLHKALDEKNFLVMCYSCNKAKGSLEFAQWRRYLPKLHQQSLDYALKILYGEGKLEELLSNGWS